MKLKKGTRVQHRAWLWTGTVIETKICTDLDFIKVERDDTKAVDLCWMPSLILNPDDFLYDWSDVDGKA